VERSGFGNLMRTAAYGEYGAAIRIYLARSGEV